MDPDTARARMVDALLAQGVLPPGRVEQALRETPRHLFFEGEGAYHDAPQPIGEGQTISAPHMVAMMAEALDVRPGQRVLEVGGGSGYHAAVLARLARPGGRVASVERLPELAARARERLAKLDLPVEVHVGDGSMGLPELAPFDRVSVAAAAPAVPPPLLEQLATGGRLVVPVGPQDQQTLLRIDKDAQGRLETLPLCACRFVPLLGRHGFA